MAKLAVAIRDNEGIWRSATCDLPITGMRAFKGSLTVHVGDGCPTAVDVMNPTRTLMDRRATDRRITEIPLV